MGKNMNNKKVIGLTIAILAGIMIIPTIYKIHEEHNRRLLLVVEKEFHYYAKQCFYKDDCGSIVTLGELYDLKYLEEKLTDPVTKRYYNEDSYVDLEKNEIVWR